LSAGASVPLAAGQFQREERAGRLAERLRRLRGEVLAAVGVVLVLALVTIGMQALLRSTSSNPAMLQSAEIVGNKLNGAPPPRLANAAGGRHTRR